MLHDGEDVLKRVLIIEADLDIDIKDSSFS